MYYPANKLEYQYHPKQIEIKDHMIVDHEQKMEHYRNSGHVL